LSEHLARAHAALTRKDPLQALADASKHLNDKPADYRGLYAAGLALLNAGFYGAAWHMFLRGLEFAPHGDNNCMNGVGRCIQEGGDYETALATFIKAHEINPTDFHAHNNVGLCYLNLGMFDESEKWARKALSIDPDCLPAYDNLALSCLAQGRFSEGWEYYQNSVGIPKRTERIFGNETRWQGPACDRSAAALGMPVPKTLMIYGEQGIGDEVMFSGCIPQAIEDVEEVYLETVPRLVGLYKRSFPKAREVVGTRFVEVQATDLDVRTSVAVLPQWYRRSIEDFDRPPHLVACPDRRKMVRGLLDSLPGKKKIGLAWTGGSAATRGEARTAKFSALYEDLKDLDATFISLEYKGDGSGTLAEIAGAEKVRHYPYLTNTQDYDDTAALVAELDGVISVTTAVVHLAGGLGVPVFILVPEPVTWKYSHVTNPGDDFYWWRSAKLIRAENGAWDLTRAKEFFR
jgi:tetratricopeptide (TPR) repeat protein